MNMGKDTAAGIMAAVTMAVTKIRENRAFEEMLLPARKRLENRGPAELAKNSGAVYDPQASLLKIASLGQTLEVAFPGAICRQGLEEWHHLLLLHYLDLADGTPVSDRLISFGSLKDGVIRGTRFDRTVEQELERFLRDKELGEVERICRTLGAEKVESKADLTMVFPFFPYYPVTVNIWSADEEFAPSGKMLLSESADHYLTVEDAVTVGEVLLRLLERV